VNGTITDKDAGGEPTVRLGKTVLGSGAARRGPA